MSFSLPRRVIFFAGLFSDKPLSSHRHCLSLWGNMAVLWPLLVLTIGTAAATFNPMELYLDSIEGFSFAFVVGGVKQYSYFVSVWEYFEPKDLLYSMSTGANYKNLNNGKSGHPWSLSLIHI